MVTEWTPSDELLEDPLWGETIQDTSTGLSFGHFNENSRRKKLKLKSKKLKTQEQKTKNSRIFSKH